MKMKTLIALATVLGALSLTAYAQDAGGPPPNDNQGGPGGGPGAGGPGGRNGHRPPLPLIVQALDTNHDGVIDADEIANASASLKKLDKNGDGKLTIDEYMGKPPGGRGMKGGPGGGGPDGQGGPGGPGGGDNNGPQGPPPGN
jgi:hypothetical protein